MFANYFLATLGQSIVLIEGGQNKLTHILLLGKCPHNIPESKEKEKFKKYCYIPDIALKDNENCHVMDIYIINLFNKMKTFCNIFFNN